MTLAMSGGLRTPALITSSAQLKCGYWDGDWGGGGGEGVPAVMGNLLERSERNFRFVLWTAGSCGLGGGQGVEAVLLLLLLSTIWTLKKMGQGGTAHEKGNTFLNLLGTEHNCFK